VANLVWFLLLVGGGIVIPLDRLPGWLGALGAALPSGALAEGLRTALIDGQGPGLGPVLVLLGWTAVAVAVAVRTVRLR
jgi:ABC-2 type transport system permease protein